MERRRPGRVPHPAFRIPHPPGGWYYTAAPNCPRCPLNPRNRRVTDAHNLLERCQAELGDPDALFRIDPGRFWTKLSLGAGLLALGVVGNYLWWFHGPAKFDAFL